MLKCYSKLFLLRIYLLSDCKFNILEKWNGFVILQGELYKNWKKLDNALGFLLK